MQNPNLPQDYAILRLLFLEDIKQELTKLSKKKVLNKKSQKYQNLLIKLKKQLESFEISNQELKLNKLAYEKIKREQTFDKLKWYFIGGLIIFFIAIALSIYFAI